MVYRAREGKKNHETNYISPQAGGVRNERGPFPTIPDSGADALLFIQTPFRPPPHQLQHPPPRQQRLPSPTTISISPSQFVKGKKTYRKHNDKPLLPLHHDGEIKSDLEPAKSLVDPQVTDATGRNEPAAATADPRRRRDLPPSSRTTRRLSSVYPPAKMLM